MKRAELKVGLEVCRYVGPVTKGSTYLEACIHGQGSAIKAKVVAEPWLRGRNKARGYVVELVETSWGREVNVSAPPP